MNKEIMQEFNTIFLGILRKNTQEYIDINYPEKPDNPAIRDYITSDIINKSLEDTIKNEKFKIFTKDEIDAFIKLFNQFFTVNNIKEQFKDKNYIYSKRKEFEKSISKDNKESNVLSENILDNLLKKYNIDVPNQLHEKLNNALKNTNIFNSPDISNILSKDNDE